MDDTSGSHSQQRHCSVCLQVMTTPLVCGGCRRRAYCSSQCQIRDWKVAGGGQCHKIWCKLLCGEEDLDWVVSPFKGKGLGLVALRHIPARYRIMVDAVRDPNDPVILDLEPKDAPLMEKISLNQLGVSEDVSVVCARLSRANHSCDANADHFFDDTFNVQILFSCRDIEPGEEICISYRTLNGPGQVRAPEHVRNLLQYDYGIKCPPICLCYNHDFLKICDKAHELDLRIKELLRQQRPQRALAAVDQLLGLYGDLRASPLSKQRTLNMAFQIAIMTRKTMPKANAFIEEAMAILNDLLSPRSKVYVELSQYCRDITSHPAFLAMDRLG